MTKNLPAPGTYPARTSAKMVLYEADSGSLCVSVPLNMLANDGASIWSGKTTITLGNSDGVLNERAINNLKKCFPEWNPADPFALQDIEPGAHELQIVGDHEEYTPKPTDEEPDPQAVTVFKIKWLNPPGGGAPMKEPLDEASRKKVLTKWGSKFKAVGGKPSSPAKPKLEPEEEQVEEAPVKKGVVPAKKRGVPMPPSSKSTAAVAGTSTAEEVWKAFSESNSEKDEDDNVKAFYAAQEKVKPDANGDLTPRQWGDVAIELGV